MSHILSILSDDPYKLSAMCVQTNTPIFSRAVFLTLVLLVVIWCVHGCVDFKQNKFVSLANTKPKIRFPSRHHTWIFFLVSFFGKLKIGEIFQLFDTNCVYKMSLFYQILATHSRKLLN